MQLERGKPYKAKQPEVTIDNIRTIFNKFGMSFIEKTVLENSLFNACELSLINPNNKKIIFSTYGKGNTPEWALASAWGEMAERFQNLAFFMILIYPSQPEIGNIKTEGFKYFPDEKLLSKKEISFLYEYEFLYLKNFTTDKDDNSIIGVPFLNLANNIIKHFPFRVLQVIVGSNGMCSGNTKEEALTQGISEIFERYVLKEFYLNPFCPPNIPLEYFKKFEIYNKIIELVRTFGYQIQIKDCSLGKGYPVIGVLVKNKKNEYVFHLGADPSPVTALERCFTEMYQGGDILFLSVDELNKNSPFNLNTNFWKKNFGLTISAYAGHWPKEIFKDSPSYTFKGFDHPVSVSDKDDLNYLLKILNTEKREVFVRDNSFLGQPTYYIYIPGMSEITCFPDRSFSDVFLEFDSYLNTLTNLPDSSVIQRKKLLEIMKKYSTHSPSNEFRANEYFSFYKNHPIAQLSYPQFVSLIKISFNEKNISNYFSANELISIPFLSSIEKNVLTFRLKEIYKKLNIPSCFNCHSCNYSEICNFPYLMQVWKEIKVKMEQFYYNSNI